MYEKKTAVFFEKKIMCLMCWQIFVEIFPTFSSLSIFSTNCWFSTSQTESDLKFVNDFSCANRVLCRSMLVYLPLFDMFFVSSQVKYLSVTSATSQSRFVFSIIIKSQYCSKYLYFTLKASELLINLLCFPFSENSGKDEKNWKQTQSVIVSSW